MFEGNYRMLWPDIWDALSPGHSRVLEQVLTGVRLARTEPSRRYVAAVADYICAKMYEREFNRRIGRAEQIGRQSVLRSPSRRHAWQSVDSGEL